MTVVRLSTEEARRQAEAGKTTFATRIAAHLRIKVLADAIDERSKGTTLTVLGEIVKGAREAVTDTRKYLAEHGVGSNNTENADPEGGIVIAIAEAAGWTSRHFSNMLGLIQKNTRNISSNTRNITGHEKDLDEAACLIIDLNERLTDLEGNTITKKRLLEMLNTDKMPEPIKAALEAADISLLLEHYIENEVLKKNEKVEKELIELRKIVERMRYNDLHDRMAEQIENLLGIGALEYTSKILATDNPNIRAGFMKSVEKLDEPDYAEFIGTQILIIRLQNIDQTKDNGSEIDKAYRLAKSDEIAVKEKIHTIVLWLHALELTYEPMQIDREFTQDDIPVLEKIAGESEEYQNLASSMENAEEENEEFWHNIELATWNAIALLVKHAPDNEISLAYKVVKTMLGDDYVQVHKENSSTDEYLDATIIVKDDKKLLRNCLMAMGIKAEDIAEKERLVSERLSEVA